MIDRPASDSRTLHRIDMLHDADVHFWCRTLDVSPAQLRAAVQRVGPQADAVRRDLERRTAGQRPS
jgi:hypothetical protein